MMTGHLPGHSPVHHTMTGHLPGHLQDLISELQLEVLFHLLTLITFAHAKITVVTTMNAE
jgi:hypothetical protein